MGQALALGMRTCSSAARNKWRSLLSRLLRRVRTSLAAALARRREGPSEQWSPRGPRSEEGDDEEELEELEDRAGSIRWDLAGGLDRDLTEGREHKVAVQVIRPVI